ncbi:MAG: hypothetical protein IKT40_14530 [Bacilli bacterium]|jgi:uncharacterized membrane protein YvbJ|nr:hypothetical protein [Bacilli bacterium]
MLCPHCHAENNYDALTCDFCLQEIPLTEARKKEIQLKKKIERQNKFRKSLTKLIGISLGVLAIIAVVIIAWVLKG